MSTPSASAISPNSMRSNYLLTLKEIASWQNLPGITEQPEVHASVPVLQRGLVWNPAQIELLWDSVLRGFPIGALVLSAKIADQTKAEDSKQAITHHLLDGQQRCDAIALGYKDPFLSLSVQSDFKTSASILWLDLDPSTDPWSTREFVVRLSTSSHPWGYTRSDDARPLGAYAIREALKRIDRNPADDQYKRPTPAELCPQEATAPLPLSWLLLNGCADNFWHKLLDRLDGARALPWHESLRVFLKNPEKEASRARILKALRRIERSEIIALCAPSDLIAGSRQEAEGAPGRANISNIEHLFQRLNQQGTPLDGEELAYSMIKAYWPELAEPIDQIQKPMPATRLISLAIRVALAGEGRETLPSPLGVSQIRQLADKPDERTNLVRSYIREELGNGCLQLGKWLRYHPTDNPSGLLPVHIASVAHYSPDLFLLLLVFAKRPVADWQIPESERPICLQAMVTVGHWFGREKLKIANRIFASCSAQISRTNIQRALADSLAAGELRPIHSPAAVEKFFNDLPEPSPLKWSWEQMGHESVAEEHRLKIQEGWREFFWFKDQRELLLYAQRDFLFRRFPDYDPTRKDLWGDHNRPWDYDHLLAKTYVHSKQGSHKGACQEWLNTIGNYRAWPMEDNRSDQAETALKKMSREDGAPNVQKCQDSFLAVDELVAFSQEHETRKTPEAAAAFVTACRKRMLRIYSDWYFSVKMAELLPGVEIQVPPAA